MEAAHFSRVGPGHDCKYPDSDFFVKFEECQNLQKLQWKLAQASPVLEGNLCVLRTCQERWQTMADRPKVQATLVKIRGIIMQLEFHKEVLRKLEEQASRSAHLVSDLLFDRYLENQFASCDDVN